MEETTTPGFVFIDAQCRPFWCSSVHNKTFLSKWDEVRKTWVTLRECSEHEICHYMKLSIPQDQAEMYHSLHRENIPF